MRRFQSYLKTTFPLMVLTGLLMLGWGLLGGPDNPLGAQDSALWGARVSTNTISADSWN